MAMNIQKEFWGRTPDGEPVDAYTLENGRLRARIMTYGATILAVETPDRLGRMTNVTLSLDSLGDYLRGHPYLGSTVGRYANRIARGRFTLDGVEYRLAVNNGPNHLHGGVRGFDKVVWRAEPVKTKNFVGVAFSHESQDGEEGYPGRLAARVVYALTDADELTMDYTAVVDRPTVVNLTNHAYWNLAGEGDVLRHELTIHADDYLPTDEGLIPTGEIRPVAGTPLDFRQAREIGSRIQQISTGGYDHGYVLNRPTGGSTEEPAPVAYAVDPRSGRTMEIRTTYPTVQLYTANGLDGSLQCGGRRLEKYSGLCLETQYFPDSPNHPGFPTTTLRPGETYRHRTIHRFGTA